MTQIGRVTNQEMLLKIRKWEQLLLTADPKEASKLTAKIVKGRGHVFDER